MIPLNIDFFISNFFFVKLKRMSFVDYLTKSTQLKSVYSMEKKNCKNPPIWTPTLTVDQLTEGTSGLCNLPDFITHSKIRD